MSGCGRGENAVDDAPSAEPVYERIIGMSPAVTEMVFALGQGDRVVGTSDYTTYPPEVADRPRCGGFFNPNLELILALEPDLIITQGRAEKIHEFGRHYGIEVKAVELTGLDSIYAAIGELGELLDCDEEAEGLVSGMREQIDRVSEDAGGRDEVDALLVVGRDPGSLREIHVAGGGGFLHDLLEKAGGLNIVGDIPREYFGVNKELVIKRAPEVIIELHGEGMMGGDERERYLEVWEDMNVIPAVRNGRIYIMEATYAMIPGPRVVKAVAVMADLLHGEDR